MRAFTPVKIRDRAIVDIIRSDFEDSKLFPHKYWVGMNLRRVFSGEQREIAFEWAVGRSGVVTNFLKQVSCKYRAHIYPVVVAEFQRSMNDGKWRIHAHVCVASDNPIVCREVKRLWKKGMYGLFMWKLWDASKGGIHYSLLGHSFVPWEYPACPRAGRVCRHKLGCKHKRRGLSMYGRSAWKTEDEPSRYGGADLDERLNRAVGYAPSPCI